MKKFLFKKILIIKHGSLGDVINSTSIIKAIKGKYFKANISILTSISYSSFFKEMSKDFEIYNDNRDGFYKTLKLLLFLTEKKYDLIISVCLDNYILFVDILCERQRWFFARP